MLKLKILILSLLLYVFSSSYAKAVTEVNIFTDDSCTNGTTALSRVVANITTLGLFTAYSANFYMDGADGRSDYSGNSTSNCNANVYPNNFSSGSNQSILHNSKSCAEGDTNCTSNSSSTACNPKGGVKICYKYIEGLTEKWDCNWANSDGWGPKIYRIPAANIRVMQNIDRLCAYFNTPLGYQAIGCKSMPDCTTFGVSDNCFVAESCTDNGYKGSHAILPMSAAVIQCVKESIARIFIDNSACGNTNQTVSYFPVFQNMMRKAVRAALTLYLILFGIRMALGNDMTSKTEFFKMGAKYILVLYFSVGISSSYGVNNQPIYDDGITTYMIPFFTNGSSSLANIIYASGGAAGLCAYDMDSYEGQYAYLSMWDSVDCRILYYFGFDLSQVAGYITAAVNDTGDIINSDISDAGNTTAVTLAEMGSATLIYMLAPAFFSFQIIFLVFSVIFAVLLLSIAIYIVNITIISMVLVAVLIYLAPLFVPMALFEQTKHYYDGWLKLLIAYALQPMIVAAYIAMMFTIFDQVMFGTCSFSKNSIVIKYSGYTKEVPIYMLCDPNNPGPGCVAPTNIEGVTKCEETIGYYLTPIKAGYSYTDTVVALFFSIITIKASTVSNMMTGMFSLCLFGYLFFKFAGLLGTFAMDVTGGTNIGRLAGDPMALANKAIEALKTLIKAKMGDNKGAADSAAKVVGGDKGAARSGATVSSGGE